MRIDYVVSVDGSIPFGGEIRCRNRPDSIENAIKSAVMLDAEHQGYDITPDLIEVQEYEINQ